MQKNKIVIIIPAYNCESYVEETLCSLANQGDALKRVDRIILTDDCSKDRTIEVAKMVWKGPVPLEIYDSPVNRGEYINMNECIARLPKHVEWYLVMHADNIAKPGWLASLIERVDSAKELTGSICTSWDSFYDDGRMVEGENRNPPVTELICGNAASVRSTLMKGCWWHISSCATRVRTYQEVGGLPAGFRLKGDWDFLMRMLGAGWDVEYVPRSLMKYRMNPGGSSSISFRRHRDVYETLEIMWRHHEVLGVQDVIMYHMRYLSTMIRRFVGSLVRLQFERMLTTVPASAFIVRSMAKGIKDLWLGRRRFRWVSSIDPLMDPQLRVLSSRMSAFYSLPETRNAYQAMIDDDASAQPLTESELRKAVLNCASNGAVLEVGCGSGRIYERLVSAGMNALYTGLEMSESVIEGNRQRFPSATWVCGSGYDLPVPLESQDCVFAYYVLEHCAYPERFLRELLSRVKPGGSLVLTFPDFSEAGLFGSQPLGWDEHSARDHLQSGRLLHAIIRLWDSRIRLPSAIMNAPQGVGPFPVNLNPLCLEPGVAILPDVDAIYLATAAEVKAWAESLRCKVSFPGGNEGILRVNTLIQITKPLMD